MDDKTILIKNWLYKSDQALKETLINIENNCMLSAQNRLYYTIFYAVSALAQSKGFITSKHRQLLGWFNKEYVKTGIIPKEKSGVYLEAFEFRQKSDYTIEFEPDKEKLEKMTEEAQIFIKEIKDLLNNGE
ncbi:MAG: hypothetical protein A2Y25_09775 [Candidatus Melainabacteria bacterium GWF2_37_15]|nr:MAG: hypothetical protein A2Y25_09775 [Candidatus Melainabacteria bacterium GWF2_37_15]